MLAVPVVKAYGLGSVVNSASGDGGQSWLVGDSAPGSTLAGVHARLSFGPPLHVSVVGLQIGHGWTAGSAMHVPPGQSEFSEHLPPGFRPPSHRFGRMSPVRYERELMGMWIAASPVAQSAKPKVSAAISSMTHVLSAGMAWLITGTGAPRRQPALVHVPILPLLAAVEFVSATVVP
jgi:hypothetical protein